MGPKRACHYCGLKRPTTWDHIVPRSIGGENVIDNMVRACMECNANKAAEWPTCPCGVCDRARSRFAKIKPLLHARNESMRLAGYPTAQ